MRYAWFFVAFGIVSLIVFNRFFATAKNNLAVLIQLRPPQQPQLIKQNGREALLAKVYSTYPFNNKSLLTINAGAKDGVRINAPVTVDGNVLLGQVIRVFDSQSVIRTIFDGQWSLAVRIGGKEIDSLLIGGQNPRLTMIEKDREIGEADLVFSAQENFPYGLEIGAVGGVREYSGGSFKEADLRTSYQLNNLREVYVLL